MRVVSLIPNATELLMTLLNNRNDGLVRLVGRSHECDNPNEKWLADIPVLTRSRLPKTVSRQDSRGIDRWVRDTITRGESLYELDCQRLTALEPDLILTQDICKVCSVDLEAVEEVASRMRRQPKVLSLNSHTFEGVVDDLYRIALELGMEDRSVEISVQWRERMYRVADYVPAFAERPIVLFLEWTDPLFVGGHWTPQLIERAGGEHPLNPTTAVEGAGAGAGPIGETLRAAGKSRVVSADEIVKTAPTHVIVCPCGLTLEHAAQEMEQLVQQDWFQALPAYAAAIHRGTSERTSHASKIRGGLWCVDGNQMFNRPGPRLIDAYEFLVGILQDREELIPRDFPYRRWKAQ